MEISVLLEMPHSTGGSGVFFIESRDELERRVNDLEHRRLFTGDSEMLVQQPARGGLSTVQTVFNRGQLIGVHTFEARRLGVGGMSTARISTDHAIVRAHVANWPPLGLARRVFHRLLLRSPDGPTGIY